MPVTSYSTTPANNNGSPPNGFPEGMAPSSLNDCMRQVMADVAVEAQQNAVKVLKSVAGTNTITADMDPELAAYAAGMLVVMTPAATNTGAVTLAIDGLTALDIQKENAAALIAGDLIIGVPALLVLDSGADDFILLNPQSAKLAAAAFTPTTFNVANCSGSANVACRYSRLGPIVTVSGTLSLTVTSGAAVQTTVAISLPIASTFTSNQDGGGTCATNTSNAASGWVGTDSVNHRLNIVFISTTSGAQEVHFVGQYEIK